MPIRISLFQRASRAFFILMLLAACTLGPAVAADMPLAQSSPLTGITFEDQPLALPVQQNFQMALLTASSELGRSCGKMEAYGWRMKQSEQGRVDEIFNSTVDRLRGLGYVVETQSPNSVSKDVTLFTADRQNNHFIFMWSAGEIGLVMVLCQSSPSLINHNATTSYPGQTAPVKSFPKPAEVLSTDLKTPVRDKATHEAVVHFSPVGKWVGSYSCAQGYTGGTLVISSLSGKNFKGEFHFYPTSKNPNVPAGSYYVFGQYDHSSHRILINPGKWIKRPHGYANTIIVGDFDPAAKSFSGFFQGITGCTSFEAKLSGVSHELGGSTPAKKKAKKKQHAKKKAVSTVAPTDAIPPSASQPPLGGAPSPGIPVGGQPVTTGVVPPAPSAVPPPEPTPAPPAKQVTPQLQPQVPTQATHAAAPPLPSNNPSPPAPRDAMPSPTTAPQPNNDLPPLPPVPARQ